MKRKIIKILVVHKKDGSTSTKNFDMIMLRYWEYEKIGGTLNKIFPLVITSTIRHFDVSRILIDGGSSGNIMYSKLFDKMGHDRGNL